MVQKCSHKHLGEQQRRVILEELKALQLDQEEPLVQQLIDRLREECQVDFNEDFAYPFLRISKFSMEKATRKAHKYIKMRRDDTFITQHLNAGWVDCPDFTPVLSHRIICEMPKQDPEGASIIVASLNNIADPKQYPAYCVANLLLLLETAFINPAYSINGIVIIFDIGKLTYSNALALFKKAHWNFLQKAAKVFSRYPIRVKHIHLVNCQTFIRFLMNSFLICSAKIKSRFKVHGDLKSLHALISPELLPTHLEGTAGDFNELCDRNVEVLKDNRFLIKPMEDFSPPTAPPVEEKVSPAGDKE